MIKMTKKVNKWHNNINIVHLKSLPTSTIIYFIALIVLSINWLSFSQMNSDYPLHGLGSLVYREKGDQNHPLYFSHSYVDLELKFKYPPINVVDQVSVVFLEFLCDLLINPEIRGIFNQFWIVWYPLMRLFLFFN